MFVQLAFFSCSFSAAHIVWEAAAADKGGGEQGEGEEGERGFSVLKTSGKLRRIFQRVAPSEHFKQLHAADMKNCEGVTRRKSNEKLR